MNDKPINTSVNQPLVSVLMTAYNREDYIAEAMESVLNSSYTHLELIVVDDCSIDNTVAIARNFEKQDSRVKVFVNEKNLGDYPNRNKAVTYASGEYLKYVDSDDKILHWGLEYCIEAMLRHPQAGWATYCPYPLEAEDYVVRDSEKIIRDHFFERSYLSIGPTGTIFRRDFFLKLGCFDTRFGVASDSFMNLRMAIGSPVILLARLFVFYRIHEKQEQNNWNGYLVNNYLFLKELIDKCQLPLEQREVSYIQRKMQKRHAINLLKFLSLKKDLSATLNIMKATSFSPYELFFSLFK